MDQGPLVTEEIDAGAELAREFALYAPLKAAFWLKASDENQRYLYLASDQINDANIAKAYKEIMQLSNRMPSPYLDPFRVKVIGGSNPLALAAVDMNRRFPGTMPTRFGGSSFGGMVVDDVYIYPTTLPVTA